MNRIKRKATGGKTSGELRKFLGQGKI